MSFQPVISNSWDDLYVAFSSSSRVHGSTPSTASLHQTDPGSSPEKSAVPEDILIDLTVNSDEELSQSSPESVYYTARQEDELNLFEDLDGLIVEQKSCIRPTQKETDSKLKSDAYPKDECNYLKLSDYGNIFEMYSSDFHGKYSKYIPEPSSIPPLYSHIEWPKLNETEEKYNKKPVNNAASAPELNKPSQKDKDSHLLSSLQNTAFSKLKEERYEAPLVTEYDTRFREKLNLPYLKLNAAEEPVMIALLYVQLPKYVNQKLYELKTQFATAAMLSFFSPWMEIQCLWVKDIQVKYKQLIEDVTLKSKFTKTFLNNEHKAVLVLSKDAGDLLRHKNTAFLDVLAATLQIQPRELIVLASSVNPGIPTLDGREKGGTPV